MVIIKRKSLIIFIIGDLGLLISLGLSGRRVTYRGNSSSQHLERLNHAVLLMLRVVRLLADLVAVVCLATTRAYLKLLINVLAIGTSLILTFFRLIEWGELAYAILCSMVEPEDVAFETVDKAFAQRESNLKLGVFAQHLL